VRPYGLLPGAITAGVPPGYPSGMARAAPASPRGLDPVTRRLILLLPVAFLAHDLGELAGNDELNRAACDLTRRFPVLAERILPRFITSRAQATVAIGTLAAGVAGLSWRAARSAPRSPIMTAYAAATLLLGAHMLPHTMQAIALRRRLPGLAGGLTISLPYSVLVVRRLLHRRLVAPDALARAAAAGAVLLVPAVLGVRALGRAVA
jgi:hypothetical protein